MTCKSSKRIFISHCHRDRAYATELQKILMDAGAETYLDQDRIQGGDNLPKRINDGLSWCDTLLLIWSVRAVSSSWVNQEWNTAYNLRRRIIPYVLDNTPLPDELGNLVYIELKDRDLGDSNLLRAVFGRDFIPDPTTLFPGKWRAKADVSGVGTGIYVLELRQNGQLEGESTIDKNSPIVKMLLQSGMGAFVDMRVQVLGNWSYDKNTQSLNIEMLTSCFGQNVTENITIQTNGRENQAITGEDFKGRAWKFWRVT